LELSFHNKKIREICEDEDIAKAELGPVIAKELQSRLADLAAATSILDLATGKPGQIPGTPWPDYKLELINGHRLVFSANHPKIPLSKEGLLDWLKVNHIKILKIETHYE